MTNDDFVEKAGELYADAVRLWRWGNGPGEGSVRVSLINALRAAYEAGAAQALAWTDEDEPLPEDDAIKAAHPTRTGNHAAYAEALRLVGPKRSKGALVGLVNWLLVEGHEQTTAAAAEADRDIAWYHLAAAEKVVAAARRVVEKPIVGDHDQLRDAIEAYDAIDPTGAIENGLTCGAVDRHGELELILTVDGRDGSVWISRELWGEIGKRFGSP